MMTEKTIDHKSRAHAVLSASSAARWLACPPSAVAATAYAQQDTPFTREGTLAHEVAEWVASERFRQNSLDKRLDDDVTPEMLGHARAYADYIEEQIKSNRAMVLLEQRVDFSPWVPDGFGTADCIIIEDDTMVIIDYKYGQGVQVSASNNPQMRLYALGALNDYGFAYDVERVEMHIFQPRLGNISVESMTVDELMSWSEHVKIFAEMAAKGEGDYNPGEHCRFCPHAGRCRALNSICSEYVNTHGLRVKVPVLAPHEIADVLAMEPLVSIWLKRVKEQAVTTMLNGGQVPGYKVVEGRSNRKWADELRVAERLRAADFSTEDFTVTELLSVAAMEKKLGKKKVAELLPDLIERQPGSPTVAHETDKRQPYVSEEMLKREFKEE